MENHRVINIFSSENQAQRKERINAAVRELCIEEVEKLFNDFAEREESQLCPAK